MVGHPTRDQPLTNTPRRSADRTPWGRQRRALERGARRGQGQSRNHVDGDGARGDRHVARTCSAESVRPGPRSRKNDRVVPPGGPRLRATERVARAGRRSTRPCARATSLERGRRGLHQSADALADLGRRPGGNRDGAARRPARSAARAASSTPSTHPSPTGPPPTRRSFGCRAGTGVAAEHQDRPPVAHLRGRRRTIRATTSSSPRRLVPTSVDSRVSSRPIARSRPRRTAWLGGAGRPARVAGAARGRSGG